MLGLFSRALSVLRKIMLGFALLNLDTGEFEERAQLLSVEQHAELPRPHPVKRSPWFH